MTSPNEENEVKESNSQSEIPPAVTKIWGIISEFKFVLLIAFLAFWVKVVYLSSTDMWDEGWFTAIFSRMADGLSDPFLPLYYPAEGGGTAFFDKPPVAFWGGAILMTFFGRSTFAAKGIVVIGGAGLAVIVYFLFSHQSENKSAAVIAGLLVALAHFLTFYSRTAYIDPFVIFMSALVMLLAVRMIDAVLVENNMRKGYILLIITVIVNVFNILTKAWQGVLTFPAIGIYLLFRYLERHVRSEDWKLVWCEIRSYFVLSPKKIPSNLIISSDSNNIRVPFPYLIAIVAFMSSFIGSYIITNLLISSLVLAIVSSIGCYMVFLRTSSIQNRILYIPGFTSGVIAGLISGIAGGLIVSIFYKNFVGSFTDIANELGELDIFSGGLFSGLFVSSSSNVDIALTILSLLSSLFGSILTFLTIILLTGVILDLFTRSKKFLRIMYEILDIIPLAILGLWFAFWFGGILLLGLFFERDAYKITFFGVLVTLILILLVGYPRLKNYITTYLNLDLPLKSKEEIRTFELHLLFTCIAVMLLILSFIPFTAWVQYLDSNIANGTFPWNVRVPGELSGDPNRPNPVTYTFLFFDYYVSWRYSHGTKYSLPSSIGSAVNDYVLIIMLPFFIVGVIAFFFSEKRNPALGALFLTWLVTVPFIFFPAQFQLNYYYIPLAIPYLAVAAKGIEYIYSSERWKISVTDKVERFLAGGYFYFEVSLLYILLPTGTFIDSLLKFLAGNIDINAFVNEIDTLLNFLFIACLFLIPFTFIAFRVLKTFPGIITAGFAYKYFMVSWIKDFNKLYSLIFHDLLDTLLSLDFSWIQDIFELGAPLVTLVGIILLLFGLYWLKDKVKPQAFIILTLVFSGMLINVSGLAHYNQIHDLGFQEMAIYINNHGGNYNRSTWVIPESGAQFAMRYYLGYEVVNTQNYPFQYNDSADVDVYYSLRPYIKFWVIVNDTHWNVPDYSANYSESYHWFTNHEHLVCVDDIVGLTSWYKIHLFVNRTWITEQDYDWTKL